MWGSFICVLCNKRSSFVTSTLPQTSINFTGIENPPAECRSEGLKDPMGNKLGDKDDYQKAAHYTLTSLLDELHHDNKWKLKYYPEVDTEPASLLLLTNNLLPKIKLNVMKVTPEWLPCPKFSKCHKYSARFSSLSENYDCFHLLMNF